MALLIDLSHEYRILFRFTPTRLRAATEALMASPARIDELKKKFDENPRRYFAPLANEFRKAGEIEQAIMICEEFLPQQPGHMSGHIVYGQALFEAHRLDEARTVFETALALDPENLIALRHLGDIARGSGDVEGARRWYQRVLEADPRNEEIQALIAGLADLPAGSPPPGDTGAASPGETAASGGAPPDADHRFAPPGGGSVPPQMPEPIDLELSEPVAPQDMPSVHHAAAPDELPVADRAEGLESVEFTPHAGPVDRAHDLGSSLEAGEFTAPAAPIAPLDGLEETSMGAFERDVPDGGPALPMLDTDAPAPQRHHVADHHDIPDVGPSTLEFSVPTATERSAAAGRPESHGMPALEPEGDSLPELNDAPDGRAAMPPELPPSVIAAEAQLLDLGEPITSELPTVQGSGAHGASHPVPEAEPARQAEPADLAEPDMPAPSAPTALFMTETMAELFLKQGFRDRARDVYRQLLAASPGDDRLQRIVADLEPAAPAAEGASVRDFLSRIAWRRPYELGAAAAPGADDAAGRPPAEDDFAEVGARAAEHVEAESVAPSRATPARGPAPVAPSRPTPAEGMSTGIERGASTQGGSIDALFGTRAPGTSEDSAASALAQAFGGSSDPVPPLGGRPARAAAGELSLDSVFGESAARPPRSSQSFSFDQFFSPESGSADHGGLAGAAPGPGDASPTAEPAERSADDIEQFNSWLQGLKPK